MIARIFFYALLICIVYGIAKFCPELQSEDVSARLFWFSAMMGLLNGVTYPLINKAYDLAKIENFPFYSKIRLQRKVKKLAVKIKTQWFLAILSAIGLVILSIILHFIESKLVPIWILTLVFLFALFSIYFLILMVWQYFHILNIDTDLREEIEQIKNRNSFWKNPEENDKSN